MQREFRPFERIGFQKEGLSGFFRYPETDGQGPAFRVDDREGVVTRPGLKGHLVKIAGLAEIVPVHVPEDRGGRIAVGELENSTFDLAVKLAGQPEGAARFGIDELHDGLFPMDRRVVFRMMLPVVPFHGGRQDERPDSIHFLVIRTGIAADGFPR